MPDALVESLPILDAVLATHHAALGRDALGYRHHVYRVVNLCVAFGAAGEVALEKCAVAAAFHDLGIWTAGTFDYLPPSLALAADYLARTGRDAWQQEVAAMIDRHHQVRRDHGRDGPLVEIFRRADWTDVTWGWRRFGLSSATVTAVRRRWPDAGFHARLFQLTAQRLRTHPLDPLPMFRL